MKQQSPDAAARAATSDDVHRLVGDLDDAMVARIMALRPSLGDLEDTAICLSGDQDVLAKSGHHVPVTVSRILEMLAQRRPEADR